MSREAHRQAETFLRQWAHSRELAREVNLQVMQAEELNATLLTILNLLDGSRPVSAIALASRMNVHPSTIVRSLDALEERGLIARQRNPEDRRELQVTLAASGLKVRESLHQGLGAHFREVFRRMPAESRAALISGFSAFMEISSEVSASKNTRRKDDAKR